MQLLFASSDEEDAECLGVIPAGSSGWPAAPTYRCPTWAGTRSSSVPCRAAGRRRQRSLRILRAQLRGARRAVYAGREPLRREFSAVVSRAISSARNSIRNARPNRRAHSSKTSSPCRVAMRLIPAIDIRDGRCVRLLKGRFDQETRYGVDPSTSRPATVGSAPNGCTSSTSTARPRAPPRTCRSSRPCARRELPSAARRRHPRPRRASRRARDRRPRRDRQPRRGASPSSSRGWLGEFGPERLVLGFDVRIDAAGAPFVATHGWTRTSALTLSDAIGRYAGRGPESRALHRRRPRRRADGPQLRALPRAARPNGPTSLSRPPAASATRPISSAGRDGRRAAIAARRCWKAA